MIEYNGELKKYSNKLRKEMTATEKFLWNKIRRKQLKNKQFYRQKIIGNCIVDFYCHSSKSVIELDGGGHYSEKGKLKDKERDEYLTSLGLKVLRFSDKEVFENTEAVLRVIYEHL